jgi:pimeloyl-ACP methyl ester carboxylesterase
LRIPASADDLTPFLEHIHTPTLVIWGVEDHLEYPESFPRLAAGLANASDIPVPGCGHQPHHGNPELVKQLISHFLAAP